MNFYNVPNTNILINVEPIEALPVLEKYFVAKNDNLKLENLFCVLRSFGIRFKFRFSEDLKNMSDRNLKLADILITIFPKIDENTWITFDRPVGENFDLIRLTKYLGLNNQSQKTI